MSRERDALPPCSIWDLWIGKGVIKLLLLLQMLLHARTLFPASWSSSAYYL